MTHLENERFTKVEERIRSVEDKAEEINGKVDKILGAVIGDGLGVSAGIIGELRHLKEVEVPKLKARVTKLEILKNRVLWMAAGAGVAGGFSIKAIIEWIQQSAR